MDPARPLRPQAPPSADEPRNTNGHAKTPRRSMVVPAARPPQADQTHETEAALVGDDWDDLPCTD